MNYTKIITNNEDETFAFAKNLAKKFTGGEIICLKGELGAGKTTFTKGFAQAFNIKKNITSPTFVIMKTYPISNNKIKQLCHIDAYRIGNNDLEAIGVQEYLNNPDVITIIEWPENIEEFLKKFLNVIEIEIKYLDFEKREIVLKKG